MKTKAPDSPFSNKPSLRKKLYYEFINEDSVGRTKFVRNLLIAGIYTVSDKLICFLSGWQRLKMIVFAGVDIDKVHTPPSDSQPNVLLSYLKERLSLSKAAWVSYKLPTRHAVVKFLKERQRNK